ncbi:hypothetical protein GH714_039931 [Hevea brasiliensis]|uniref:Uncharacterized protein n=1 Tax=Hevea brasiliensis TaxID=3981 RepID=A0A6A6M7C6_HEVBR|nr:hypothetical protein GH714_039931 [Hevea brasiliensis]
MSANDLYFLGGVSFEDFSGDEFMLGVAEVDELGDAVEEPVVIKNACNEAFLTTKTCLPPPSHVPSSSFSNPDECFENANDHLGNVNFSDGVFQSSTQDDPGYD